MSFFAPATGLLRALDIAVNEYQGGQDYLAALGRAHRRSSARAGPAPMNDLQFLTGPSVADIDAAPGEEIIEGTASLDLAAFNAGRARRRPGLAEADRRLDGREPAIGSFGTLDTDGDARNGGRRDHAHRLAVRLRTARRACPLGSWPRFHHDNANSGDSAATRSRPGKPTSASVAGTTADVHRARRRPAVRHADHYEIVTSNKPIDGDNFDQAQSRSRARPQPAAAGSEQSYGCRPAPRRSSRFARSTTRATSAGPRS